MLKKKEIRQIKNTYYEQFICTQTFDQKGLQIGDNKKKIFKIEACTESLDFDKIVKSLIEKRNRCNI